MRVGIDLSPLQNGNRARGIGTYARGLLNGLRQVNFEAEFLLYHWKSLGLDLDLGQFDERFKTVPIPQAQMGRLSTLVTQQLMGPLALPARNIPDVFHQTGVIADLSAGIPWPLARRTVATIHDIIPLQFPREFLAGHRLRQLIYRSMLALARQGAGIIVPTQSVADLVVEHIQFVRERVSVVPQGLNDDLRTQFAIARTARNRGQRPYILTVAGDYPNKGIPVLLEAFRQVREQRIDIDLMLIGPQGAATEVFGRDHPNHAAHIQVVDYASLAELATAYCNCIAVVVPSIAEGFGLPALEAMAAGSQLIVTSIPPLLEITAGCALLIPIANPTALADRIIYVAKNGRNEAMIRRGIERAQTYTWKRTAELTIAAYIRATYERGGGR